MGDGVDNRFGDDLFWNLVRDRHSNALGARAHVAIDFGHDEINRLIQSDPNLRYTCRAVISAADPSPIFSSDERASMSSIVMSLPLTLH